MYMYVVVLDYLPIYFITPNIFNSHFFPVLQDFYITLRKQHQGQDSTPITTRQLESLIRLTESRARLELREVATKEDAEDVIEIMKYRSVSKRSTWRVSVKEKHMTCQCHREAHDVSVSQRSRQRCIES